MSLLKNNSKMFTVSEGKNEFHKDSEGVCLTGFGYWTTLVMYQKRLQELFTQFTTKTHVKSALVCHHCIVLIVHLIRMFSFSCKGGRTD